MGTNLCLEGVISPGLMIFWLGSTYSWVDPREVGRVGRYQP